MRRITSLLFSALLFITAFSANAQYTGGNNDGASTTLSCALALDGSAAFSLSAVTGSVEFCDFSTESYSITVIGGTQDQTFVWTVPAGASIISGQGTTSILVQFGNTSGNVRVDVFNACSSLFSSLPVTAGSCTFFNGGSNDGFSRAEDCASNLDGGSVFIPGPIVGSTTFCDFATESYSIAVAGANPETTYTWSVPAGATITGGQGTTNILVTFGTTAGNISVDVANACETINVFLPVSSTSCLFYAGGDNDGFSNTTDCASNLNGGSVFIPGPIVGSITFCDFATETYSIAVAGETSETSYAWSVPPGATITSGQGTTSILVTFGNTSGNVSVDVSNPCETINISLPVSSIPCLFYAGGNNDGFSNTTDCASNLNGGSTFIPGPIVGSTTFCDFATESYSISVGGATAETTYVWSAPVGATITTGQGTNTVLITFGNTAGNVSVDVSNPCETINISLAVAPISCIFYAGGNSDGFAFTLTANIPLPVELTSFEAQVINRTVVLKWETASELNNDFFTIERSIYGEHFEPVMEIKGSGTTTERKRYQAEDRSPYSGRSFYRLSQTDFDGTRSYSHVVLVDVSEVQDGVMALYPNPVSNAETLSMDYNAQHDGVIKIVIFDATGRLITAGTHPVNKGNNTISFIVEFSSGGVYFLQVGNGQRNQGFRLVVN